MLPCVTSVRLLRYRLKTRRLKNEKMGCNLCNPFPESIKELYEKMRLIDELGKGFPTLDLTDIRILLKIYETPGYSIRELAEALKLSEKTVQLKIAVMGRGRKKKIRREPPRNGVPVLRSIRRVSRALELIAEDRNMADGRKRSLATTPRGAALAEKLTILIAE